MPSPNQRSYFAARNPLSLGLRVALLALALPGMAAAQDSPSAPPSDEPTQLETMVVTAQKREQQVEEVPIAITAYSGEFLDKLGITTLGQLAGYVPGLQVQEQSPNNPGFVIRGITSDSGDSTVQPRVSVFQDGVSISRSRGASVELFDMQRVEVLRGPQGTLFGRAAEVGAVHLIQNKARDENSGQLEVGAGAFDQRLVNGYLNASIAPDALFARVAVFHEERDGSIDNAAGGTLNGKDTTAVRASLGMRMGEASSMDFILNYQHDTPPGTAFRSATIPTRRGSTGPFDAAELNRGDELGLDRTVRGVTVLGNFALNDSWALNSITGWRTFDSHEEFDGDGSQLYALEFAEIAQGEQWSQEFRLNFDDGERFAGFMGASYFFEDGSQRCRSAPMSAAWSRCCRRTRFPQPGQWNPGGLPFPIIAPVLANGDPTSPTRCRWGAGPAQAGHQEGFANYGTTKAWDVFWTAPGSSRTLELSAGVRASGSGRRPPTRALPATDPPCSTPWHWHPAPLAGAIFSIRHHGGCTQRGVRFGGRARRRALCVQRRAPAGTRRFRAAAAPTSSTSPRRQQVLPAESSTATNLASRAMPLTGPGLRPGGLLVQLRQLPDPAANPAGGTPFFIPTNGGNATARASRSVSGNWRPTWLSSATMPGPMPDSTIPTTTATRRSMPATASG